MGDIPQEADTFAWFETIGEAKVRDTAQQWSGIMQDRAYRWLQLRHQEARLRLAVSEATAEEERRAERQETKRDRASDRRLSVIAIVLSIVSAFIALLTWLFPRA